MEPTLRNDYIEWFYTWMDNYNLDTRRLNYNLIRTDIFIIAHFNSNYYRIRATSSMLYTIHMEYLNDLKANGYYKLST